MAAESVDRSLAPWASLAGLWHDLGKFRPGFQLYIRQDPEAHIEGRALVTADKTHSAAGALHALQVIVDRWGPGAAAAARVFVYVIAGHHAGLDDWHQGLNPRLFGGGGSAARRELEQALSECRRSHPDLLPLPSDFDLRAACAAIPGLAPGSKAEASEPLAVSLFIRMLFSALVDADFLDTEAYFDRHRPGQRAGFPPLQDYRERLDAHLCAVMTKAAAEGRDGDPVMRARAQVLARCRSQAALPPGVFTLTVPTGGGKTLASLAFALTHAQAHGLRRVVVAIPYTSIIEQTADVFAGLFGHDAIVEHHSQADAGDDARATARSRLACENWDAPLIVTTNVQLLESLFARRTSRCRKLHRLAGSVIVLDEAQLLPPPFLQPILDSLRLLVRHYGVTLLLCTATQPVLTDNTRFDPRKNLRGLPKPTPVVDNEADLYDSLERVRFEWPADWHECAELAHLAVDLARHECVLAVVNTRRDAADLVAAVDAATGERCLHLSAAMCGQHRADVIAQIRQRLAARRAGVDARPLRVISTQLVEAGVDIDFPVVYRALAGLDSIAQAAGRCNREGLLGALGGRVVVFVRRLPAALGALKIAAAATVSTLAELRPATLRPAHFEQYFKHYHAGFDSLDERGVVAMLRNDASFAFDFRTAAEKFRLVDDEDQASVVVPYRPSGLDANDESPLNRHIAALKAGQPDRWRLRALQRFMVCARLRDLGGPQRLGSVEEVLPGLYLLRDPLTYDARLGLNLGGRGLDAVSLVQ